MRRVDLPSTESTNLDARRLASEFPGETIIVTAAVQTGGRGRVGRQWQSPAGGAWFGIAWPLAEGAPAPSCGSLLAAIAVYRGVREVVPDLAPRLRIKWPNDLLVDELKVAGILCELVATSAIRALIVGIGVNVDFDPALLGSDLRRPATTLRATAVRPISVAAVIDATARQLEELLPHATGVSMPPALLAELRHSLAHVGAVETWQVGAETLTGRVLGVDDQGRLLLGCGPETRALAAGEQVTSASS